MRKKCKVFLTHPVVEGGSITSCPSVSVVLYASTVGFLYSNKVTLKGSRLLIRDWGGVNTHFLAVHVSLFLVNCSISCTRTVTPRSPI